MTLRKKWLVLALIAAFAAAFQAFKPGVPTALSRLTREIDAAAQETLRNGRPASVRFVPRHSDAVLLLCAPYSESSPEALPADLPAEVLQQVKYGGEAGHLFYLRNGRILSHATLGYLAMPVTAVARGKTPVVFRLTRTTVSGRLLKLEMQQASSPARS